MDIYILIYWAVFWTLWYISHTIIIILIFFETSVFFLQKLRICPSHGYIHVCICKTYYGIQIMLLFSDKITNLFSSDKCEDSFIKCFKEIHH